MIKTHYHFTRQIKFKRKYRGHLQIYNSCKLFVNDIFQERNTNRRSSKISTGNIFVNFFSCLCSIVFLSVVQNLFFFSRFISIAHFLDLYNKTGKMKKKILSNISNPAFILTCFITTNLFFLSTNIPCTNTQLNAYAYVSIKHDITIC